MHHAHLIIASPQAGILHAKTLFNAQVDADPDLHILAYETFGIDEARMLSSWAYQKPVSAARRAFIITCDRITSETQNALLKLFEDPPQTSVFSLIVRDEDMILPTLRSRFMILHLAEQEDASVAHEFLKSSYKDRLERIAERTKAKDASWQRALLAGLELHFRTLEAWDVLEEVSAVARMIGARGASPKMLLEHLALSVPVR